jgi:hypothetical protein
MYKFTLNAKRTNEDCPFIYQSDEGARYNEAVETVKLENAQSILSFESNLSENKLDYTIDIEFVNEQGYQKYLADFIKEYPDFIEHRAVYFTENGHELYMFVTNEDGTNRTGRLC